jgi:predicted RNA-binding protein
MNAQSIETINPTESLREVSRLLAMVSRALSQGNSRAWVEGAAHIRETAVHAGLERLANRCRQLEEIHDVEHTHIATLIFEGIAQEFARAEVENAS